MPLYYWVILTDGHCERDTDSEGRVYAFHIEEMIVLYSKQAMNFMYLISVALGF